MDFSQQHHHNHQFHYQHQESSAAAYDPSQSQSYDPSYYAYPHHQQQQQQQQQFYDCSSTQTYSKPDPAAVEVAVAALSQLSQFAGTMAERERHVNGGSHLHPHQHPQHYPVEDGNASILVGGDSGRMGGGPFRGRGRRGKGPFSGGGGGRGNFNYHPPRQDGGAERRAPASFRGRGRGRMGRCGGKKQHQTTPDSQPAPAVEQSSAAGGGKQQALSPAALPHFPLLPIVWCDICRVDCNSLQILEQHKNGKRHKKTVQRLEEIQKMQKLFAESQAKIMPDIMLPGAVTEKITEVGEVKKISSAPKDITTAAMLPAQVGKVMETSDTVQMNDANKTCIPERKPAVVLTAYRDLEAQVDKTQAAGCHLEPATVGGPTDVQPSAASVADEHLTEGSKEPPSSDGFDRRHGGMKRKMTVGRGRKRLRSSEPVQGQAPKRPKERPRLCTLCSVMCESLVVFESHIAGKKHLSKIKRFQGQGTVYGPITVYIPPNQASSAHPTPGQEPLFFGLMNHEMLQHETYIQLNGLQAENHRFHQDVQGDHSRGAEGRASEPQAMEGLENVKGEVIPAKENNEVAITNNAENQCDAVALDSEPKEPETAISKMEAAISVTEDALPAPDFGTLPGDDSGLPGLDTEH